MKINNKLIIILILIIGMISVVLFFVFSNFPKQPVDDAIIINDPIMKPTLIMTKKGVFSDMHGYINKKDNMINGSFDYYYSGKAEKYYIDIDKKNDFLIGRFWQFTSGTLNRLTENKEDINNEYPCNTKVYWRVRADKDVYSPVMESIIYCPQQQVTGQELSPQEADKKNRDAKRISDIKRLSSSLGLYLKRYQIKDQIISNSLSGNTDCKDNWIGLNLCQYISSVPIDPINNNTQIIDAAGNESLKLSVYRITVSQNKDYRICTYLESKSDINYLSEDGFPNDFYEVYSTPEAFLCE